MSSYTQLSSRAISPPLNIGLAKFLQVRHPATAAALFSLHNLAESFNSNGYEANYIEFGGDQCAQPMHTAFQSC